MKNYTKISSQGSTTRSLKTFPVVLFFIVVCSQQLLGQVNDDFSDGDFTVNPTWTGDAEFVVENAMLRSNGPEATNQKLYLQTPNTRSDDTEWSFQVDLDFNPTSANFVRIYLVSDQPNLEGPLNGYFIQLGQTSADVIKLFRQDGSSLVEFYAGSTAFSGNINARIRVRRSDGGLWEIACDPAGGFDYVSQGDGIVDNTYTSTSSFGIYCEYATASRHDQYHIDDIYVGDIIIDGIPPAVESVNVISATQLEILFSEPVEEISAETSSNYLVENEIGNPVNAELQVDGETVLLTFGTAFINGKQLSLTTNNVKDLYENFIAETSTSFMFFQPVPATAKDIIISELLSDPAPVVALPEAEFVEIFNRSNSPFDLNGWQLTDGSNVATFSARILLPGEYLIITSNSSQAAYSVFGSAMGVSSFPSLNNTTDNIRLLDPDGKRIDSVSYTTSWYNNDEKKDGGWTLELINPDDFCSGSGNWKASADERGGTPGAQNSVFSSQADLTGPKLVSLQVINTSVLNFQFDEKLSIALPEFESFVLDPPQQIQSLIFADETLRTIQLVLNAPLDSALTYSVIVQGIYDCPGNEIDPDFTSATIRLDTIAPTVDQIQVISSAELSITFSERVDPASAGDKINYEIEAIGNPLAVELVTSKKIKLSLDSELPNGIEKRITIKSVFDPAGNVMEETQQGVMFFNEAVPAFKDVVFTEIFFDPAPVVGLPEAEFIEIFNRSNGPFNLNGWTLSDETSTAMLGNSILLPGDYVILCASSYQQMFSSFGKALSVSGFPSLNNTSDMLVLKHRDGRMIDSVSYNIAWLNDDEKTDGGWSIEIIDPENHCAESENWAASENEPGGTPGSLNSVFANKPDLTGPKLISVFPDSDSVLTITFDEKLEKHLPEISAFSIEPARQIHSVEFADATLRRLRLNLDEKLHGGTEYALAGTKVYDCAGNILNVEFNRVTFALPEQATSGDIMLNEILFNPRPTGVDFVEIYNRSEKFINLKDWKLANIGNAEVVNPQIITTENLLIRPGNFVVLTEDSNVLKGEYVLGKEETFFEVDLPSFSDDEGSVALVDSSDNIIEGFYYSDEYHSPLVRDAEGVSLERISFENAVDDINNWKSASSASGYATPGYINSNSRTDGISDEAIQVEPEIFVPQSGNDDFAMIRYQLDRTGYLANVRILDSRGREVKRIANNELISQEGFFRWDGDDDNGGQARVGSYMVWVEVFDPSGIVKTFRKRVVVAAKF